MLRFGRILKALCNSKRRTRQCSTRTLAGFESLESRQLLSASPNDLAALNDEFDSSSNIADWQRVNEVEGWNADQLQVWDVDETQAGQMVMQPHTVVWYQDWRGPMVFKEVSGDFIFTSEVVITDRDDVGDSDADDVPDDATYSLGGLMIRTPRDISDPLADWQPGSRQDDGTNNGENYVFLSLGHGVDGQFSFEVKTTRNSNSQLELTPLGQEVNTATLRVARIGDSVITMYRLPDGQWTVHRRFSRPDMPETLQLGLVTYTDWNKANDFDPFVHNSTVLQPGVVDPTPGEAFNPDLVAGFEYARFARPQVPTELAGVDLVDAATDQQLLSFLGDAPTSEPDADPEADPDPATEENTNAPDMAIGMNLVNLTDWDRAWVFRDAFKMARPWSSRLLNTTTYEQPYGGELVLDEQGWVTQLETTTNSQGHTIQQRAQTYLFSQGGNPAGTYRAEWTGEGTITFGAVISEQGVTADGRNYALLDVAEDQQLSVTISQTNAANYIRDIQIFMPDYNGQSLEMENWQPGQTESPFHPLFIQRLQPFDTIRFMQWQEVNQDGRELVTPQDMRPYDYATQATAGGLGGVLGVSVEYMVQLVNELGANPWFTMPHSASDDYVRTYAEYVRDNVHGDAQIYVEWSNEVWNAAFGFETYGWIQQQLELPENAGLDFYDIWAREARRDFEIWREVFAGQENRVVRVAAAQQSTPWVAEQLLARMDGEFDAVSSTSYSGLEAVHFDWVTETTTPEDIIDYVLQTSVPWSLSTQQAHVQLAEQYSQQLGREIAFVTYEGGSHLSAFGTPYADLVQSALDSPRMREVYQALLGGMEAMGVDMHTQYVFTGQGVPSPWGEYAVLSEMDLPLQEAHEYQALVDFIAGDLIPAQPPSEPPVITDQTMSRGDDMLTFELPGQIGAQPAEYDAQIIENTAATLNANHGLYVFRDDFALDWGGQQEKWLQGDAGYYYLLPTGEVFQWTGSFAGSNLLATLDTGYYDDPALLVSAEPVAASVSVSSTVDGYALTVDPAAGYVGSFTVLLTSTFGDEQAIETFVVTVQNQAPQIAPIDDVIAVIGGGPVIIDLNATDADGDSLSYEVRVEGSLAAQIMSEHNLYEIAGRDDYALNWGGQNEKWLQGDEGWYFLLPDGTLNQWGGSFETSTQLVQFATVVYDDPQLLLQASVPDVAVEVVDGQLVVTPSGQSGTFQVEVTVNDGAATASTTFNVEVTNNAPSVEIADQDLVAGSPLSIQLPATDADGHAIVYTVEVLGDELSALDGEHGFWSDGNYYTNYLGQNERWIRNADNQWHYLLPTGELYRWEGSFETSTLVAQLGSDVYDDPSLLTDPQPAPVIATLEDGVLTILADAGYVGEVEIRLTADDGYTAVSTTFRVIVGSF